MPLLGLAMACGEGDEAALHAPLGPPLASPYDPATTTIELEVDYVHGAEPFVGKVGMFPDIWSVARDNLELLFPDKHVQVPSTLGEMEAILRPGRPTYGPAEIRDLAEAHREPVSVEGTARYYALWLDGWYEKNGQIKTSVSGVALTGRVIALFKPVISITDPRDPSVPAFVEQSTLVHELGHALGLVELGVTAADPHLDPSHDNHCDNPDCVMYYLNEGASDLRDFAARLVETGEMVLFDQACQADVAAANASGAEGRAGRA